MCFGMLMQSFASYVLHLRANRLSYSCEEVVQVNPMANGAEQ